MYMKKYTLSELQALLSPFQLGVLFYIIYIFQGKSCFLNETKASQFFKCHRSTIEKYLHDFEDVCSNLLKLEKISNPTSLKKNLCFYINFYYDSKYLLELYMEYESTIKNVIHKEQNKKKQFIYKSMLYLNSENTNKELII